MDRWTEAEFERVADKTRIQARTLEACKDVLVNGMAGTEAASKHQMFQAQISRALTTLRDAHARSGQIKQAVMESPEVARHLAVEIAKGVLGPATVVTPAEPGKSYAGKIAVSTVGYIVQKVGRSAILHDKADLSHIPEQGAHVEIAYGAFSGKAVVTDNPAQGREKRSGIER